MEYGILGTVFQGLRDVKLAPGNDISCRGIRCLRILKLIIANGFIIHFIKCYDKIMVAAKLLRLSFISVLLVRLMTSISKG